MYMFVNWVAIDSGKTLLPVRRQAIAMPIAHLLSFEPDLSVILH